MYNNPPTVPKSTHVKKRSSAVDTTTLINNTSSSTIHTHAISSMTSRGDNNNAAMNKSNTNQDVTITIQQKVPAKSIRIERDYSLGDGITRFSTQYPFELEGKITEEEFGMTIKTINELMDYADRLSWRIVLENIMETLTIYVWPIFFSTHYQRAVKKLNQFIESQNNNIYHPHQLSISDPVKAAFLFIEINFYD